MRHPRFGMPRRVLAAAVRAMAEAGLAVEAVSGTFASAPLGPSRRRYANAAALVASPLEPEALLESLQRIEKTFGRRRAGRRWRARVLDLDIVLWSGGAYHAPRLVVPHPRFRERLFVLAPAREIAPAMGDPVTGLTLRQLHARLTRAMALA